MALLAATLLWTVRCGGGQNAPQSDLQQNENLFGEEDLLRWPDLRADGTGGKDLGPADTRAETHPVDVVEVPETLIPPDVSDTNPPVDIADVADVLLDVMDVTPDVAPDVAIEDVAVDVPITYCNGVACPAEKPLCKLGKCACDTVVDSCNAGSFCFTSGECLPCDLDSRCGLECQDCGELGASFFCAGDGSACVECDLAAGFGCPMGQKCVLGECVSCSSLGLCGMQCLQCQGATPDCSNGKCVCNAGSCGPASVCEVGACVACTQADALHCGASCAKCSGANPHCKQGQCTLCNSDSSCGPTCSQCPAGTPFCRPDGQGCVQCLFQADCPGGTYCTPIATCGECLDDSQCLPAEYCGGYQCLPDKPTEACPGNLSPDGATCPNAKIIGRTSVANKEKSFSGSTSMTGSSDDVPGCDDTGNEDYYRIYLEPGDKLDLTLSPSSNYDAILKVYLGTDCDNSGTTDMIICRDSSGTGFDETYSFMVVTPGWYSLVVDGGGFDDDYGSYGLDVKVTCTTSTCTCP